MKKLILLLISLVPLNFLSAQNSPIDSLERVLLIQREDTARVNVMNALASQFENNNPDSAIYFANKAQTLAIKLGYAMGIANSKLGAVRAFINLGKPNEALKNCNDALKIYDQLLASAITPGKSIIHQKRSLAYNAIGISYIIKGIYPEALKNLMIALKIREETGDEIGISYTENNIGIVYWNQEDYPEALKHYLVSLKIREKHGDKRGASASYSNIGGLYEAMGNYPEALKNYSASLKLTEEINDKDGLGALYINFGSINEKLEKYSEALKYHFASLKIFEETGNKENIPMAYYNIGTVYRKQKKYTESYDYINKSLMLAKEMGQPELIQHNYNDLAILDSASGNFKQSFKNYKLYITYRDSLFNQETTKKLVQTQMQYDFDKKESLAKAEQEKKDAIAIEELQKQKLVRNGFVGGFAVVLLFAGVFFTQRNKIKKGKARSDELLLNILPSEVAEELKAKGSADAKQFDDVTVMFTDFKNFTQVSEKLSPSELVAEIDYCFKAFDNIITKHNIEKIKTIGDSYMCAGGLPVINETHADDVVKAALEIEQFMQVHLQQRKSKGEELFEIRIGIHTGPVVAGIVGVKKFAYDIWGDTVNTASRMESSGEAGKVNISGSTYELVKDKFNCTHRGKIQAKNKGEVDMYFVESIL